MAINSLLIQENTTPSHLLTKEPIILSSNCDGGINEQPVRARRTLVFNTNPAVGNVLSWNITGDNPVSGTITFIAVGATRALGSQCFVIQGGQALANWIETRFFQVLREIPAFDDWGFSFSGPSSTIDMNKTVEDNTSLSFTATGFTISTPVGVTGQPADIAEDYYLRLKIQLNRSYSDPVFNENSPWHYFRFSRQISPTAVTFIQDISRIVDEMIGDYDVWDEEDDDSIFIANASVRRGFVKVQEYIGGQGVQPFLTVSNMITFVKGGRQPFSRIDSFIDAYKGKFLTNRNNMFVDRRMSDWLYFIRPDLAVGQNLRIRTILYKDYGLTATIDSTNLQNFAAGSVVRIPCGLNQLHNGLHPDTVAYSIGIIQTGPNGTDYIIEPLMFYVRPESDYVSALQYFNTFGFLESILLEGNIRAIQEWDRKSEYVDVLNPDKSSHTEIGYEIAQELIFECSTAPLSKEGWSASSDIGVSKKHFWVNIQNKNIRHAVVLEKGKSEIGAFNPDGNGYASIPMKLRFPITESNSIATNLLDI